MYLHKYDFIVSVLLLTSSLRLYVTDSSEICTYFFSLSKIIINDLQSKNKL